MEHNKCPYEFDIELWQIICNFMEFSNLNYLLSGCKNLWFQLRIYKLPRKYGEHITDEIICNDKRFRNLKLVNFYICLWIYNEKITDTGLQYLTKAKVIKITGCDNISESCKELLRRKNYQVIIKGP